jgi:hypothetical protein
VRYSSDAGTSSSRASSSSHPSLTSSIRAAGLVDDAGKSVPSSAEARKKWEEEITEEIRSEISTHEQEIEALRNEMALLRNRRLLTAKACGAWTSLEHPHAAPISGPTSDHMRASNEYHVDIGAGVRYLDEGAESEDESLLNRDHAQRWSHGPREGFSGGDRAEKIEIERLRCDAETLSISLRQKDRERQVEVEQGHEQQVETWRREADQSLAIAEQLRCPPHQQSVRACCRRIPALRRAGERANERARKRKRASKRESEKLEHSREIATKSSLAVAVLWWCYK